MVYNSIELKDFFNTSPKLPGIDVLPKFKKKEFLRKGTKQSTS